MLFIFVGKMCTQSIFNAISNIVVVSYECNWKRSETILVTFFDRLEVTSEWAAFDCKATRNTLWYSMLSAETIEQTCTTLILQKELVKCLLC